MSVDLCKLSYLPTVKDRVRECAIHCWNFEGEFVCQRSELRLSVSVELYVNRRLMAGPEQDVSVGKPNYMLQC